MTYYEEDMAVEEKDYLDALLSRICPDILDRLSFKLRLEKFLTNVPICYGEEKKYKLNEANLAYQFRYNFSDTFIKSKETQHFKLTRATSETFFQDLERRFQEDDTFFDQQLSRELPSFNVFEQNVKEEGVVLFKSEKYKKALILVKKDQSSRGRGGRRDDCNHELFLDLKDEATLGIGSCIRVGDIVEVIKPRRKDRDALEPEIIKCFLRSKDDILKFLQQLQDYIQRDGSTAALTELSRCQATWEYTLQLSGEQCDDQIVENILQITNHICSTSQRQMSQTLIDVIKPVGHSPFFTHVLPKFVERITKQENSCENCSLIEKFLEHILNVSPSCGQRVLSMAKMVARHMVSSAQDFDSARENGQHAVDFLGKLSSVLALQVRGAFEDTEALNWRKLPLIPVPQEIRHVNLKTDDLPVIKKEGKYPSEEEYLNTYFRLLREECFHKLKKGITSFVSSNKTKFDTGDIMLYRISLRGVATRDENRPVVLSIGLKYTIVSQDKEKLDFESIPWLKFGNLLCISFDGNFEDPGWAVVEKHLPDQNIVWVTLCKEAAVNNITEAQLITELQEIGDKDEEAYMAESQTFYVSFGPAMDVLQHKDHVPLREFLVDAQKSMEPADYIAKITRPPDWGIIFRSLPDAAGIPDEANPYSLLEDFNALKFGKAVSILDNTQLDAVELTLKNKLTLIQGPPGTGKSFVGVNLVKLLVSMDVPQNHGPILVVTYKNFALDHFLDDCLKTLPHDAKVVRVGSMTEEASEKLKKCSVFEVGRSQWTRPLFSRKRKLTGQLWAMQPQVAPAYIALTRTSIFCADTFLEEAPKTQLRYLLTGFDVDPAEVEKLLKDCPSSENRLKEEYYKKEDGSNYKGLVEKALKEWLPPQEKFDSFPGKEDKPTRSKPLEGAKSKATSPVDSKKQRDKKTEGDTEDPNDVREPCSEERERRLAVDEEPPEDDEGGEDTESEQQDSSNQMPRTLMPWQRKLAVLDSASVKPYRNLLHVHNVWDLTENERIQLVYVLQAEFHKRVCKEFQRVTSKYVQIHQKLQELKSQQSIEVMRKCAVIGMTVTGAAMRANLLADIKPSVMIVEEAAEILEGQLVAVIPPSVQHLIMIGDHKQLKPVVHCDRLRRNNNLDLSMFERLVKCKLPYQQLGKQCRMIDRIADLLRKLKIYDKLETNFELVTQHQTPSCVEQPMYFWTHTEYESQSKDSHSKRNSREAREIVTVAEGFCQRGGVQPSKITVLCSYRGQVDEIKREFKKSKVHAVQDIAITTIDSFQGQENDIILISLVRSNKEEVIGYLKSMNRLCVAISRARCGLYLFGNSSLLAQRSAKGWRVLRDAMQNERCHGRRFPFCSGEESERHYGPDNVRRPSLREQTPPQSVTVVKIETTSTVTVGDQVSVHHTQHGVSGNSPSGKIPVQDPQSPRPESPITDTFARERRDPSESRGTGKQGKISTQENQGTGTIVEESENLEHCLAKDTPVQETENPKDLGKGKSLKEESAKEKEKPIQETENPAKELVKDGKEMQSATDEKEELQTFEDQGITKIQPVQETEEPQTKKDDAKEKSVEEDSSQEIGEVEHTGVQGEGGEQLPKELVSVDKPMQETKNPIEEEALEPKPESAHKEPQFEELEHPEEVNVGNEKQQRTGHIQGMELPIQATDDSTCLPEEPRPSQETLQPGKGPFEESDLEVGVKHPPSSYDQKGDKF